MIMQSSSTGDCVRAYDTKILNLFDSELQMINTKAVIENKLKGLLGELKKFKVKTFFVSENKKIEDHKTMRKVFHSCANLIADDSDIDKAFGLIHQSVVKKIKNYFREDLVTETIVEHSIKIFKC